MLSKNSWSQIDHIKRLNKLQPLIVFLDVIQNSKITQTNICTLLKLGMDEPDILIRFLHFEWVNYVIVNELENGAKGENVILFCYILPCEQVLEVYQCQIDKHQCLKMQYITTKTT